MRSKIVLFVSIGLSVFLLLGAVGVANAMKSSGNNLSGNPTLSPEQVQQLAAREAAYNDLVVQANQRIETLNNEVSALKENSSQAPSQPAITADTAANTAIKEAGGEEALLKIPELVNYQGTSAFEVKLEDGVVYVDAQSGKVIFNGVTPKISEQQARDIAGKYMGGMDGKYANVKLVDLNGTGIYQVTFEGPHEAYVVFIDSSGKVVKAQIVKYTGGGGGGGAPSGESHDEGEHESGHDD
ncbi:MAG: PepSY domain-containing protein [Leptolinea sp.]